MTSLLFSRLFFNPALPAFTLLPGRSPVDSVHDVTDKLRFLQFLEFVGRLKLQCPYGADAHAGRLQTDFNPFYAQITFLHFIIPIIPGYPEGTCEGATMASDAECFIHHDRPGPVIPGRGPGGTANHTRAILAMHAAGREMLDAGIGELPSFNLVNPPKSRLPFFRINIILIHTGDHTCAAAHTKL